MSCSNLSMNHSNLVARRHLEADLPNCVYVPASRIWNQQARSQFALSKQTPCLVSVFADIARCLVSSTFYRSGWNRQMGPPPAIMEAKMAGVADLRLPASVSGSQPKWRELLYKVRSNGSIRLRIAKQTKSVVVCSRQEALF